MEKTDCSSTLCVCVVQVELREEQQRYRQYLADELQRQRREEEEADLLIEEKLNEVWAQRDEKSRIERETRNRLMKEMMEARSLQIQHKCKKSRFYIDSAFRRSLFLMRVTSFLMFV